MEFPILLKKMNDLFDFIQKYSFVFSSIMTIILFFGKPWVDKLIKDFKVKTVFKDDVFFKEIYAAKAEIVYFNFRNDFRQETITAFMMVLLQDEIEMYCKKILTIFKKEKKFHKSLLHFTNTWETIAKLVYLRKLSIPKKAIKKYKASLKPAKNLFYCQIKRLCKDETLTKKQLLDRIRLLVIDFLNSAVPSVMNELNNMNGDLKDIVYIDPKTKKIFIDE